MEFFKPKTRSVGLRVLTITATFPSLIQPWLVNQLVQIIRNGGENRILARQSETGVYNSNIDNYHLNKQFALIPDNKLALIAANLKVIFSISGLASYFYGLCRFPRVLFHNQLTLKEKLLSILMIPYMGLRHVDVIHSHSEMAGNRFMPVLMSLNKPLVVTFHGLPPVGVKPITNEQRKRYVSRASVILVNTEFAKQQYVYLGGDESKIRILPQGIELEKFPFRRRPFPENGVINILTVGRFHPDKGQKYAISAVADLIRNGYSIKYRFVGNGPDKEQLQLLSQELGVENHIEFYSRVSDEKLQEIYDDSHIFILPSLKDKDGLHEETQGVVLQEAQASGLITIATKVGGIPECVDDGQSGFLVDERSSEAIEKKIIEVIKKADEWNDIQERGREWVEQRYSIEVIGGRINQIYKSIVNT